MKINFVLIVLFLHSIALYSQSFNCEREIDIDSIVNCKLESNFFQSEKITDGCKLSLISGVSRKYLYSHKVKYMKFLVQLYNYSDGIFTDEVCNSCSKIFDGALPDWFKYLYKNRNDSLSN